MMLPEVLRRHPQLRPVFDRYGLRGCGGVHGPAESVAYFARAHGVDEERLLEELKKALDEPAASVNAPTPGRSYMDELADAIYRRFFKAGVVVVLTAGAVWGAILLLRIGVSQSFTAISIHEINAHGHAQIFGWVGLFVMGFGYQAFPRLKHTSLWRPDLANMSFYLMVFGVFARAIGEPLFTFAMLRELAVAANLAELAAIGLFILVILKTLASSPNPLQVYDGFVVASMFFFLCQAVADLGLVYATTAGVSRETLLHLVSTYQGPLRDLQIHGFAMLMILGVGLRMFPALFGFAAVRPRIARLGLVLLATGVIGEAGFFILMRELDTSWATGALYGCMVMIALVSIVLTARWGLLARPTERDRSVKFIRAAAVWLHISMLMLVLMPVYAYAILPWVGALSESGSRAVAIGFSHAYGGAVRHAITVGFISLMILGMAAKVVPTLNGVDIRGLRGLWVPFVLVNVGCAMRVGFQVLTDFGAWAYPIAGVSGLLEVAGIAVWGLHLWRIMNGWNPVSDAAERPSRITLDHKVGHVVEWFPQTLPVFIERGFAPLASPLLRRTVARAVTIRRAAAQHGIDADGLLEELNAATFDACCHAASDDRAASVRLPVLQ
jgi:hypothetical protein